jgi:non-canonical purine NTP pyrophosphatase (RdgB/HAM1 family)
MAEVVFITGNMRKLDYLKMWLGLPIKHHKLDLEELQSLDARTVAEHKARQAYEILKEPVLTEDTSLVFTAMGRLPGTFVKFFLEEIGTEGMCRVADTLEHRKAVATVTYAYCDGKQVHFFEGSVEGEVAREPRGTNGMGWDATFIPKGATKTFAEMTDDEKKGFSARAIGIKKLRAFLDEQ